MKNSVSKSTYLNLLNTNYNGNEIWKQFNQKNVSSPLTCSIALQGNQFHASNAKLMVYGRAMNGWETDYSMCSNAADVLEKITTPDFSFSHITTRGGIGEDKQSQYYYSRSKFWKLIKYVLEEYGDANEHWYDQNRNMAWNEKIIWSNLYKISPRYSGNPDSLLMKNTIVTNIDIATEEVANYKPDRILFITDKRYMEPFSSTPSFKDAFNIEWIDGNNDSAIVGFGTYGHSKIIVCKRPDIRGYTNQYIRTMAREIKDTFEKI